MIDLDELEKLAKATDGDTSPLNIKNYLEQRLLDDDDSLSKCSDFEFENCEAMGKELTRYRTAVPEMAAELRRLRTAVAFLRSCLRGGEVHGLSHMAGQLDPERPDS